MNRAQTTQQHPAVLTSAEGLNVLNEALPSVHVDVYRWPPIRCCSDVTAGYDDERRVYNASVQHILGQT